MGPLAEREPLPARDQLGEQPRVGVSCMVVDMDDSTSGEQPGDDRQTPWQI